MKTKNQIQILKTLKASILLVFLIVEFFGFGVLPKAQAACTYTVTRLDAQSAVTSTGQLNINTTINRQGTSGDCLDTVQLVFLVKADYMVGSGEGASQMTELSLKTVNASFNGTNSVSLGTSYSLSGFDWTQVPNPNQLQLFMRVYAGNTNVTTSGIWNISVTGASGATPPSGARNISISFDRATYNKDDVINVAIKLDNPSGAPDVVIVTSVNGKTVGSFPQSSGNLGVSQAQAVTVTTANGFGDGANSIQVQMFQQGSNNSILFAQGSASVQAQGLGASVPTGGGNNPPTGGGNNPPTGGGNNPPSSTGSPTDKLYNPLPEDSLTQAFLVIVQSFLGIVGIWAVMFIIVGGFQMVMASGNEEMYAKAKKTLMWAVLGLVIALLSFSIIAIVQDLLKANVQAPTSQNIINQHQA